MTPPISHFVPGPTHVPAEALAAMDSQLIGHRSEAYRDLHTAVAKPLQGVFRTAAPVVMIPGSATVAMEAAIASLVEHRVLHLVGGGFAQRWLDISRARGVDAEAIEVEWGHSADLDRVRDRLRSSRFDAVTITHSETSTGVLEPLQDLAALVRDESDALVMVDGVSSVAGAPLEFDEWGIDLALTGTQKALAAPPGIAFAALSDRAVERAATVSDRGFYTDLLRHLAQHEGGFTLTTPPINVVRSLQSQLDRIEAEGMEARWARHEDLRLQVVAWAEQHGVRYASADGAGSPTVSCLRPPEGVDPEALVAEVAVRGFTLGSGYGPWRTETFRIGHMGEVRSGDLAALLDVVTAVVSDLGGRA
jgi:aspartate aminotransferase-like enzyme